MPTFSCPSCGKVYRVNDEAGGRLARCSCGATIRVPGETRNRQTAARPLVAGTVVVCTNAGCGQRYRLTAEHSDLTRLQCAVCKSPLTVSLDAPMTGSRGASMKGRNVLGDASAAGPSRAGIASQLEANWDDLLPRSLSASDKSRLAILFQSENQGVHLDAGELEERRRLVAKSLERDPTSCPYCWKKVASRLCCSSCHLQFATGLRRRDRQHDHPLIAKAKEQIRREEAEHAESLGVEGQLVAGGEIAEIVLTVLDILG